MKLNPLKILLIEDNLADADWIGEILVEDNLAEFDLKHVKRVKDALDTLCQDNFDAILLDLSLPDSQGMDSIARVKKRAPQSPIVVLTSLNDRDMAIESVRQGAQDYLIKGRFEGELLFRSIRYAIERQRTEAALRQKAEREKLMGKMLERIRQSLDLKEILQNTVTEVRQFLKTDRVFIYRCQSERFEEIVVESVEPNISNSWNEQPNLTLAKDWGAKLTRQSADATSPGENLEGYRLGTGRMNSGGNLRNHFRCRPSQNLIPACKRQCIPHLLKTLSFPQMFTNPFREQSLALPQDPSSYHAKVHRGINYCPRSTELNLSLWDWCSVCAIEDTNRQENIELRDVRTEEAVVSRGSTVSDLWVSPLSEQHQTRAILTLPIWQNQSRQEHPNYCLLPTEEGELNSEESMTSPANHLWGVLVAHNYSTTRKWHDWEITFLQKLTTQVTLAIQQSELYTQLQKANQQLQQLAILDSLTGVANRRYFDRILNKEWKRLTREQKPLSLLLCDIDYFKDYNDTYGHQAGDRCLSQVAAVLKKATKRAADLVARYGGEEFAVILPDTNAQGALFVANAIRQKLQQLQLFHCKSAVSQYVTLSIGSATKIPNPNQTPSTLIKMADDALYRAKKEGRDRILQHDIGNFNY